MKTKDELKRPTEMNIAGLIKERQRLDEYCSSPDNDDDCDYAASDRRDDVQDAIDGLIYERSHRNYSVGTACTGSCWSRSSDRGGLF